MFSIEENISNQIHKTYAKSGVLRRIRRFVPKPFSILPKILLSINHLTANY